MMLKTATLVLSTTIAAPLCAQESTPPVVSLGVTAGTLGIGPEAGVRLSSKFGVRANAALVTINGSVESDGIDYDGSIRLRSAGVMADLFPFGGGFRLSAGARINGNNARLSSTPSEPTEIGDVIYSPQQIGTLTGRAETKSFAPALTLGYGGSMRSGFVFGAEAGVLFQGAVRIRDFSATGSAANEPQFADELARQRSDLQADVNDYKLYPILQLSAGYRF